MRRRWLLLASGTVVSMTGCVGGGGRDEPTEAASGTGGGTAAGGSSTGVTVQAFNAADVRRGGDEQRLTVALSGASGGETVEVYVDVGSLGTAAVGLDGLGVAAEARYGHGWTVTGAAVSGDVVRVTVAVDADGSADDVGTIEVLLTGLDTEGIEHTAGLTHAVVVAEADGDPDFSDGTADEDPDSSDEAPDSPGGTTATYDVVDPDELENVLRVRPDRLRVGDDRQRVHVTVEHATAEVAFRMDLSPLSGAGVGIDAAGVEVVAVENNVEDDLEPVDVVKAAVVDGVVRLDLATEAEMVGLVFAVTGLETGDAEGGSELSYPVWVGERPPEPAESRAFRVAGATA